MRSDGADVAGVCRTCRVPTTISSFEAHDPIPLDRCGVPHSRCLSDAPASYLFRND